MNLKVIITLLAFSPLVGFAQPPANKIKISEDIEVTKLSDKAYVYVATAEIENYGPVPSNGLILVEKGKAFLFDTPVNNEQTETLANWVKNTLHAKITGFVPNHWHADCVGGLEYLQKQRVTSYAGRQTADFLWKEKHLTVEHTFQDSLSLKLDTTDIRCYYLGGGHSTDNIVVWIQSEKILFGGCMVKDMSATGLGNTSDAALNEWPVTISSLLNKFPDVQTVIPGHGQTGGIELLQHTLKLLDKQ